MTARRTDHVERECKMTAGEGFVVPDLHDVMPGITAEVVAEQELDATYYDTADLRLARSGVTARFRTQGHNDDKGTWTIKFPEGDTGPSLSRREIDFVGERGDVPRDVASLVRAHTRSSDLEPVARLLTHRCGIALRNAEGDAVVEVADDDVSITAGTQVVARFREIEVELLDGASPRLMTAVVERLRVTGATVGAQAPKLVQALGERALEPPDVVAPKIGRKATLADVLSACIADGLLRLVRHDPGVRLGGDPEDVHQARVAARRLRSDLRTFSDVIGDREWLREIRDELKWLGGVLGHVRDADVLLARLSKHAEMLPDADALGAHDVLERLEAERDHHRGELLESLDSDRYIRLLDALAAASRAVPASNAAKARATEALPGIVRKPWKQLRRAVSALGQHPPDEDLHQIRISAKRARYAAEAAADVVGKPATRFAKAAAGLQTVLGDLQDAAVAESWLRGVGADSTGRAAVAVGELIAIQRASMDEARDAWPKAWAALSDKKLSAWLSR